MRILLTGCAGFIGSNLLIKLLNDRYEVLGIDNLSNSHKETFSIIKKQVGNNWRNFKFFRADIRSLDVLTAIVYHEKIDAIIHLAAMGSVTRSFELPIDTFSNNVTGFINIMTIAKRLEIKKFIYASSSSVYGNCKEEMRYELIEPKPNSPYSLSKFSNEQFCDIYARVNNISTIGLRFFNVYGPMQLASSQYSAVIPSFINDDIITINGNGSVVRDFTYVSDIVSGIVLALEKNHQDNLVYNLGTGIPTTIKDLAEKISLKLDKKIAYQAARANETQVSYASIALAEEDLGYKVNVNLDEGLDRTIEFYKTY